ncbi:hypothetical protein KOR42_21150 [Thalassoglobus neptunius]|uniref:RNA polymerase sigma factor n=1 Tax=Thalassoglobus neptunius TaxID=1938619 RepID=A0A5C5X7T0_9PLAN|nr:sigma-70 family RNA polymerase sigma factor [Thalassoglobus neptunius]TWT58729.1 hypothetical protein KOR42_21150 [Thalassoglobus neptunius]
MPTDIASPVPFQTTRWTLVRSADRGVASAESRDALAELCQIYWYPLYAFARRRGSQSADAQEQVQGFLSELLSGALISKAEAAKGKFRSFLLKSFQLFLSNERRRENAQKRGGGCVVFSIDAAVGEERYSHEPVEKVTPEALFERQWALTILEQVVEQLRQDYRSKGKEPLFERLLPHLTQKETARPYQQIAESLAMNETAVKVAAFRLRKRFRELLREVIADTIDETGADAIDDELNSFARSLSS